MPLKTRKLTVAFRCACDLYLTFNEARKVFRKIPEQMDAALLHSVGHVSKGKAVPLQAWSGPEGSRKLRFPDYMTTAQDGGKVSLTHRPPLPQEILLVIISVISQYLKQHRDLLC
jgi:hypothetical protein